MRVELTDRVGQYLSVSDVLESFINNLLQQRESISQHAEEKLSVDTIV